MKFVASEFVISEKILAYAFVIFYKFKVNTLSAKACFLKIKIDTPFEPNLFKTSTSFLHLGKSEKFIFIFLKINIKYMQRFYYFKSRI